MSRKIEELWFPTGEYMVRLDRAWSALNQALADEKADGDSPRLMTEELPSEVLGREYAALREEAQAEARSERRFVRLEALSRSTLRSLKEKHPPRTEGAEDDVKADRMSGMNIKSVEDDLVYASIIEPEFSSRGDFDEWADEVLSGGEFEVILQTAWTMAVTGESNPKPRPASQTQRSDATSD